MVHLSVTLDPTVSPVIVVVGECSAVIVAVPDTTVHVPVPIVAVFPAKVVVVTLHKCWSVPAFAVVGAGPTVKSISSVDTGHVPLLIVHRKLDVALTVKPVTNDVADVLVVTDAVPDNTDHSPVPTVGVFAASVVDVELQII